MGTWTRRGLLAAGAAGALAGCTSEKPSGARPGPTSPPSTADPSTGSSTGLSTGSGGPRPADWDRLRRGIEGDLARPRDPSYDRVRLLENPRFDDQRPLAVLSVASAADVAAGIAFAREHDVPFAVRSGGHSYPGWSGGGSPRALVIDCRPLSRVRLDGATATIGAGASLVELYDQVGRGGRAIAGGSCATVGIGGLTLGGGVGVLSRAMGLTCDAVSSMEVVTADGRVRTASGDEEPDLFWALRGGGGGHLGVVTSFDFATSAAPTVTSGYLQWPISAARDVVEAWQRWAPAADPRLWSTLKLLGGDKHPDGPVVIVSCTWTGPAGSLDARLAGLLDHVPPPAAHTTHSRGYREAMFSYAGCASVAADRCHTGAGGALDREAFAATSHVMYDELDAAGIGDLLERVLAAGSTGLREAGVSLDALGGHVRDLAPGDTAFVHREALATVQYTATFPPGTERRARRYVHAFRAAMLPHWGNHAYVNYADPTLNDHRTAYFGGNADRLAEASRAYDPDGVFTQPQGFTEADG